MSYLTFPRLHFSGKFKAYPSTINNIPINYKSTIYPNIEEVQLVWAPKGTGEITLVDCTITMIEYEDGSTATTPQEDPIIGQPIFSVPNPKFIAGALVDLDPDQQMVSEIWGMRIQIGGENAYLQGYFEPAAFNSMWGNVQGANAPQSSASASVTYQSSLTDITSEGLNGGSRFLHYFTENPAAKLSINFMIDAHNNNPVIYSFNTTTFQSMAEAGVPQAILDKITPMQKLKQQICATLGDVPTKDFVTFQLQQYLNTKEYNTSIDTILKLTQVIPYQPTTPYDFAHGFVCGTVGTSSKGAPNYFVPSRMMAPNSGVVNFAPFAVGPNGTDISINLSNSLSVENPGIEFFQSQIGQLELVCFPNGEITIDNAVHLAPIDYMATGFLTQNAGMFTTIADQDVSSIPLGIISTTEFGVNILLSENPDGYYLRANQYVFRMNPGVTTSPENPRGETAQVEIHALKFGKPVPDQTQIIMKSIPNRPSKVPERNIGVPASALTISPSNGVAETTNGVATFTLTASDPGNPRQSINGQIYFKSYQFADPAIAGSYNQDPGDFVSVQVYNLHADDVPAIEILNKYGYLYKIMGFLTDDTTIEGIGMRNMIKTLLQQPFRNIQHMPVTRDLSIANRQKIIDWIDNLNDPTSKNPQA